MSRWDNYGQPPNDGDEATGESSETKEGSTRTVSDGSGTVPTGGSSQKAKLRAYDTLRDEVLSAVDRQVTLNSRGVAGIILVIGYSVNFDQLAVLAFVPVILAYLLVRTAESRAWMANASGQIAKIEQELTSDPTEDSFGFEHQLGGFGSGDIDGVRRLRDVPAVIRILFVGAIYAVAVLSVVYGVWPLDETPQLLNVEVTRSVLLTVYGVLTASF